jgi:HAD superfamily hydrolase (TIGR01549 family)
MMDRSGIISGQIDLTHIRGFLFDVDGTLSDTDDHLVERISRRLDPLAWLWKDRDPRRFARWFLMTAESPANALYSLADRLHMDAHLAKLYDWYSRRRYEKNPAKERFWLVPGVNAMLDQLKGRFPMGVVSARDRKTTLHFLEHFNLMPYFEVIVTAQTCQHTKPFPDPVIYAAQALGLEAKQCVMVGDTIVDVVAGRSAGAQTMAVLCGFGTKHELARAGADLILSSTAEITQLIDSGDWTSQET